MCRQYMDTCLLISNARHNVQTRVHLPQTLTPSPASQRSRRRVPRTVLPCTHCERESRSQHPTILLSPHKYNPPNPVGAGAERARLRALRPATKASQMPFTRLASSSLSPLIGVAHIVHTWACWPTCATPPSIYHPPIRFSSMPGHAHRGRMRAWASRTPIPPQTATHPLAVSSRSCVRGPSGAYTERRGYLLSCSLVDGSMALYTHLSIDV